MNLFKRSELDLAIYEMVNREKGPKISLTAVSIPSIAGQTNGLDKMRCWRAGGSSNSSGAFRLYLKLTNLDRIGTEFVASH